MLVSHNICSEDFEVGYKSILTACLANKASSEYNVTVMAADKAPDLDVALKKAF